MIHVVQQGECFSSIAARYGMKSWKELYEHPDNAELKKTRANPNVLAPGDQVVVPEPDKKWMERPTEKKHRFVVPRAKAKLRIVLRDDRDDGVDGKRFIVNVDDNEIEGKTVRGLIEVDVPATASAARLRVWVTHEADGAPPNIDRDLAIGHLDPIDTTSGIQARLRNLGYRCNVNGESPDRFDDPMLVAARAFRARYELPHVDEPNAPDGDDKEEAGNVKPQNEGDTQDQEQPTADADLGHYIERLLDEPFRSELTARYEASGGSA